MDFSCCEKLDASLFQQAIDILQSETLVAVRVGVDPMYAILIQDASGPVRFLTTVTPLLAPGAPAPGTPVTQFSTAGQFILGYDPAPGTGKIENIISNVIVLTPLPRL
jgi:hypothetical protein